MEYEIIITNQVGLATSPDLAPDRSADPVKREPMKLRTIDLVSAALLASLLLAGCSNSNSVGDMPTGETSSDAVIAPFNDADSEFAMNMIVHHTQAIEMADVLLSKEDVDARVVELAQNIKAAQGPEIDTMNSWLDAWGVGAMAGMDHGMGETMSEDDMAALEVATGAEAGRLFLVQMTVHHQGAIEMARFEIEDGENTDAIALAEKIISDQASEIALMKELLATL